MTLVAITAGKAAPGATTTTLALALAWRRPVLVIDADPDGGDIVPGLLPGRASTDRGLLSWSVATRRHSALQAATAMSEHVLALPEAEHVWLLPGVQSLAQSAQFSGASGGWERLARVVERIPGSTGRDVLVDTGRLGERTCWPVLTAAERVVVVSGRSARSIQGARNAALTLQRRLGDLDQVVLLAVGEGPYEASEIARALDVRSIGALPQDRRAAAALTEGARLGVRGLHRTRLVRAAVQVAERLAATQVTDEVPA